MRVILATGLVVLATAGSAQAGPLGLLGPRGGPPGRLATTYAGRPFLNLAAATATYSLWFAESAALWYARFAIGPAVRTGQVIVDGPPYPGQPLRNVAWIAFPIATTVLTGSPGVPYVAPPVYYAAPPPPVYYWYGP